MAKHVPLQLMMVNLTDGRRGLFVGIPLVSEEEATQDTEVEDIMFSDIQQLPEEMTVAQLMKMVREQICPCNKQLN